jgi:acyl-CoA synthetase (AMP-forming)/AMP-acid ligase II
VALIHSLLAAGIPFALFPASPTPYELRHLVKVSKIKKIFTSPRNFENARIAAKVAGFSESNGIFILEGKVKGQRSFDDLVRSVKEPSEDYAKPVDKDALAGLIFSSGTTGLPKGEKHACYLARAHHAELLGVMISHENLVSSMMQGLVAGNLNNAVEPVSFPMDPILLHSH